MNKNELITKMFYDEGRSLVVLTSDLSAALKKAAETVEEEDLRDALQCAERIAEWVASSQAERTSILDFVEGRSRASQDEEESSCIQLLKDIKDM